MKDERLSFEEAYDIAQQENIVIIHGQALVENELFDAAREGR